MLLYRKPKISFEELFNRTRRGEQETRNQPLELKGTRRSRRCEERTSLSSEPHNDKAGLDRRKRETRSVIIETKKPGDKTFYINLSNGSVPFRTPAEPTESTTEELVLADTENPPEPLFQPEPPDPTVYSSSSFSVPNNTEPESTTVPAMQKPVVLPPPSTLCVKVACMEHSGFPAVHCIDLDWSTSRQNNFRPLVKSKVYTTANLYS